MAKAAGAILAALAVFWTGSFVYLSLSRGPSVARVEVGPLKTQPAAGDCPEARALRAKQARAHAV